MSQYPVSQPHAFIWYSYGGKCSLCGLWVQFVEGKRMRVLGRKFHPAHETCADDEVAEIMES